MPDIELLGILRLICDAVKGQQTGKKFNFKTMKPSRTLSCNANPDQESRSDYLHTIDINSNMLHYFTPNTGLGADKRESCLITQNNSQ